MVLCIGCNYNTHDFLHWQQVQNVTRARQRDIGAKVVLSKKDKERERVVCC